MVNCRLSFNLTLLFFVINLIILYNIATNTKKINRKKQKPMYIRKQRQIKHMPINIPTQSIKPYSQIGILHNNNKILPLMGRQVHSGSYKWNYHTMTNNHIPIRIPLENNGKNCEGANGCKELYSNDTIYLPEYNDKFTIKLYDKTPRYIPYI